MKNGLTPHKLFPWDIERKALHKYRKKRKKLNRISKHSRQVNRL